ncbi:MAG: type II toxin-antitoxin system prevent-host-death family antitoxin [Dehalococcoidia bacterium]|nr:type II toxin-antitoxin system prevent-host-death family antitoxin [Dehalococcoidia bacterium]
MTHVTNRGAVPISDARGELSELVNRVAYRQDRIRLSRRGRELAALVSIEDVERLEALDRAESQRPTGPIREDEPAFGLRAEDYPVLAEIWDNEDDDIFDELYAGTDRPR